MRYFAEYIIAIAIMVAAIFVSVKPASKEHWPIAAKISIYCIAVAMFLTLILFEYFVGRPVSDIVRQAVGDTFCRTFAIESCPLSIRTEIARQEAQRAEKAKLEAEEKRKDDELKRLQSIETERAAYEYQKRQVEERAIQAKLQAEARQKEVELERLRSIEIERAAQEQRRQTEERLTIEASRRVTEAARETRQSATEVSSVGTARPATLVPPKLIQAMFFTGEPLIAATTSGTKFKMTFAADGKITREPQDKAGQKGEGTWSLSEEGFCTSWKGSAANCYTLVNVDKNKWSVVKGATTVAVWSK
jgi:hypothetical protein